MTDSHSSLLLFGTADMTEAGWFVYVIECRDKSFYCGIATDVDRRLAQHSSDRGARYTRGRGPLRLVWRSETPVSRSEALKLELKIKSMNREQKKAFMEGSAQ